MIFLTRTFPLLLGVFLISVLVRLPQLNRPLSKHHEFCTAVSLRVISIWNDSGIERYGFNPVMNFANPNDKFINNHANASGKMIDTEGNFYYVSHPPFAYYFAFYVFSFLGITPDVLPLQILNLLLHFLSGLFVYFTVCLLSFNRARSYPHLASLVAFTTYIFLPPTLWFQGNVYMSDMLVHTLFVISVYTVLKMIIRQKFYSIKYIFFYVLVLFMMIYTSWLGLFFAFGVVVYSLLHVKEVQGYRVLIALTVITSLITLRIISYQYAQINGLEAYFSEIVNRYLLRGSINDTKQGIAYFLFSYFTSSGKIVINYIVNYAPVYLVLLLIIKAIISQRKMRIVFSENGYRFIWLSVLPILLLHFVFLNYSIQDFTTLYASLFFSVLLGIFYDKFKKSNVYSAEKINRVAILFWLLCIANYQLLNLPGEKSVKGIRYDIAQKAAEQIASLAGKDEVIFIQGIEPEPQEIWYAKRNIQWVENIQQLERIVSERKVVKWVLFNYSTDGINLIKRADTTHD